MNLRSSEITIPPNTIWKVPGVKHRRYLWMNVGGEQKFDVAFVPIGRSPDNHWLDGVGSAGGPLVIPHSGDIYIRDTNNVGDETFRFVSDVLCTFEAII